MGSIEEKQAKLQAWFEERGPLAISFSGGVDSTFVLAAAHRFSPYRPVAFTALVAAQSREDQHFTNELCRELNIRHEVFALDELSLEGFKNNPPDRCYLCKQAMYRYIASHADQMGLSGVVDGTNLDDLSAERPGRRALLEQGILLPLVECELTKAEIREISHAWGLPTWDKPSDSCLYTRLGSGEEITQEKLDRIRAAEAALEPLGLKRVRARLARDVMKLELEC